jgi:hypothetical protein
MARDESAGPKTVNIGERPEELTRASVDDHGHPILDENVTGKQDPLLWQPNHQVSCRVCGTGVSYHQRVIPQTEGVYVGNGNVRLVGKLETTHGIETDYPHPVGNQSVLPGLGGKHAPVRMGKHVGAEPPEHHGAKVMIGMMMRQDQPFDRLRSYSADCSN